MGEDRDQLVTGPNAGLAGHVRAHVAATNQQVQRARQRVAQAMAQVRHVDQLLHSGSADDPAWISEAAAVQAAEVMGTERTTHRRAVELQEAAAELQEEGGRAARAAVARAHAAQARARSRRAREELATHQARVAAAQDRADQVHKQWL